MLSEELFIKHVRKQHLQFHIPGPCVYDINTTNILSSPQGNWGLVLKDLQLKGTRTKKFKLLLPAQLKQKTMQKQALEKLVLRSVLRSEVKKMLS